MNPLTRRSFLLRSATSIGALGFLSSCDATAATRDDVLTNHVGFATRAGKFAVVAGTSRIPFEVVRDATGEVVHRGTFEPRKGDHGDYAVGEFTALHESGTYRLRAGDARSGPMIIDDDAYLPAVRNSLAYFTAQRCGATCHLDDGIRKDDGARLDVTGGWHDACDVRRWVDATIYGMIGLSRVLDVLGPGRIDAGRIIDELRWGNRYFLKMQDPTGFVMRHCGGDDGNHFTDNQPGTKDDRRIHVEPADMAAQFNFIAAQAAVARHVRAIDPDFAKTCQKSAETALFWCLDRPMPGRALTLGAAVLMCCELHRTTGADRPSDLAGRYLKALLALQVKGDGFFRARADQAEPSREIMDGNLPLIALCDALETFPGHADAPAWRAALQLHVDHLAGLAKLSAFGTIPFGLYTGDDPGGARRFGPYFYRWSMKTRKEYRDDDWWVGINAHLASHGIGLLKAANLLDRPDLAILAQRQLDWILGANPFNTSTVSGAGRNQPKLYVTGAFKPPTPLIPGGVMNGIGGDGNDRLTIRAGSWNTCEYWTPMVSYAMWLMAELSA